MKPKPGPKHFIATIKVQHPILAGSLKGAKKTAKSYAHLIRGEVESIEEKEGGKNDTKNL